MEEKITPPPPPKKPAKRLPKGVGLALHLGLANGLALLLTGVEAIYIVPVVSTLLIGAYIADEVRARKKP